MKTAIITGGSRGLGLHMSHTFLESNYKVIILDCIDPVEPSILFHEHCTFISTDMSKPSEITKAFAQIENKFDAAHILINNAAIASFEKHILDISLEDYNSLLDTNLRGAFLCAQAFIRLNKGEKFGRIINISSTRWHQNEANWELYGMSKGGIVSLTNSLCVSLIGTPITVNAISPGYICTGDYESLDESEHAIHPSNRVGKPQDISRACLFLADEKSDFINGANLVIDGGMTKKMIY